MSTPPPSTLALAGISLGERTDTNGLAIDVRDLESRVKGDIPGGATGAAEGNKWDSQLSADGSDASADHAVVPDNLFRASASFGDDLDIMTLNRQFSEASELPTHSDASMIANPLCGSASIVSGSLLGDLEMATLRGYSAEYTMNNRVDHDVAIDSGASVNIFLFLHMLALLPVMIPVWILMAASIVGQPAASASAQRFFAVILSVSPQLRAAHLQHLPNANVSAAAKPLFFVVFCALTLAVPWAFLLAALVGFFFAALRHGRALELRRSLLQASNLAMMAIFWSSFPHVSAETVVRMNTTKSRPKPSGPTKPWKETLHFIFFLGLAVVLPVVSITTGTLFTISLWATRNARTLGDGNNDYYELSTFAIVAVIGVILKVVTFMVTCTFFVQRGGGTEVTWTWLHFLDTALAHMGRVAWIRADNAHFSGKKKQSERAKTTKFAIEALSALQNLLMLSASYYALFFQSSPTGIDYITLSLSIAGLSWRMTTMALSTYCAQLGRSSTNTRQCNVQHRHQRGGLQWIAGLIIFLSMVGVLGGGLVGALFALGPTHGFCVRITAVTTPAQLDAVLRCHTLSSSLTISDVPTTATSLRRRGLDRTRRAAPLSVLSFAVRQISGSLTLQHMSQLESVNFPLLTSVDGTLRLVSLSNLHTVTFDRLLSFNGDLETLETPQLSRLTGLSTALRTRGKMMSAIDGTMQLGTYLGDEANTVSINARDNSLVVGGATRGVLADGVVNGGGHDGFIAKYSSQGNIAWLHQFDTPFDDAVYASAVHPLSGSVVVGGATGGAIGTSNVNFGSVDMFVALWSAAGESLWTYQTGSSANDVCLGVAMTSDGGAVACGYSTGAIGNTAANLGGEDLFALRISPNGTRLWAVQLGGTGNERAEAVVADSSTDEVYVVGHTSGAVIDGQDSVGGTDGFVFKLSGAGSVMWGRQFGSSGNDYVQAGAVVSYDQSVIVVGHTNGQLASNAWLRGDGVDILVAKFNGTGTLMYLHQFGTLDDDYALGVAIVSAARFVVCGWQQISAGGSTTTSALSAELAVTSGFPVSRQLFTSGNTTNDKASSIASNPLTREWVMAGTTSGSLYGVQGGGIDVLVVQSTSKKLMTLSSACDQQPCLFAGTCVPVGEASFSCVCPMGTTGATCETNFDDCRFITCRHGGTCVDLVNDFRCDCPSGFVGESCGSTNVFRSAWKTDNGGISGDSEIWLPLEGGPYDFRIEWGDGTTSFITSRSARHTYESPGTYILSIFGTIIGWNCAAHYDFGDCRFKLLNITSWGSLRLGNGGKYFMGAANLEVFATDSLDLTGTTYLHNMFYGTSSMTGISAQFPWDVSKVTDFSGMFSLSYLFNGDIESWDMSSATTTASMFSSAFMFNGSLHLWDVSSVTNFGSMFQNCPSFNGNVSHWDVSSAYHMGGMFSDARSFNQPLYWTFPKLTSLSALFARATSFNGDISSWDVSSVTTMPSLFARASTFNRDLSLWDVSSVTQMNSVFEEASSFNGDISNWNVSSANEMSTLFLGAVSFNGDISKWNVSSAVGMWAMFKNAASFNGDISNWHVANVKYMQEMFSSANSFNGNLQYWDVSQVTDMSEMFKDAHSFNSDISSWKVARVNDMDDMFNGASAFNRDLSLWCVSQFVNAPTRFHSSASNWTLPKPQWGSCP